MSNNPMEDLIKLMSLPMESSAKYLEVMEKGQVAMQSMAQAQKDMAAFQKCWEELQELNPLLRKQARQTKTEDKPGK